MGEDRDNHIRHPDRLKVVLEEAGVEYDAVPSAQPGELVIVAFLARDDGAMDIEELNHTAYRSVLRIAQACLRFANSDLRGLLVDEWGALRDRAEAAEAEVARLKKPRLDSLPGNLCLTLNEDYSCSQHPAGFPVHTGVRDGPGFRPAAYVNLDYVTKLAADRDKWRGVAENLKNAARICARPVEAMAAMGRALAAYDAAVKGDATK